MTTEDEIVKLRGRIAALELATVTQAILDRLSKPGFNPVEFAAQRTAFWKQIGSTLNDDDSPFSVALEDAFERLGNLLVMMAKPIDEAQRKGGI